MYSEPVLYNYIGLLAFIAISFGGPRVIDLTMMEGVFDAKAWLTSCDYPFSYLDAISNFGIDFSDRWIHL
jgi:hypothetical protein